MSVEYHINHCSVISIFCRVSSVSLLFSVVLLLPYRADRKFRRHPVAYNMHKCASAARADVHMGTWTRVCIFHPIHLQTSHNNNKILIGQTHWPYYVGANVLGVTRQPSGMKLNKDGFYVTSVAYTSDGAIAGAFVQNTLTQYLHTLNVRPCILTPELTDGQIIATTQPNIE